MLTPYHQTDNVTLYLGDALDVLRDLPTESVHCCVTSPPYWGLRNYGVDGQLGMEPTPDEYVARMAEVFREVRRVLRADGTCWLNLGDSYAHNGACGGSSPDGDRRGRRTDAEMQTEMNYRVPPGLKQKDLVGIPWRVAFALQADGWYLRQDLIWHKPNPMPESVRDRCTKAHEYLFLLAKSARYHMDMDSVREEIKPWNEGKMAAPKMGADRPVEGARSQNVKQYETIKGANRRSVWTVATQPFAEAHFATFPPNLIKPCVLAGCPAGGVVLDPFNGAGTTGLVARHYGHQYIGIDINAAYLDMTVRRLAEADAPTLFDETTP